MTTKIAAQAVRGRLGITISDLQYSGGSSAWPVGGQADETKDDLGRYRAAPAT
jgi:hypothetical protein